MPKPAQNRSRSSYAKGTKSARTKSVPRTRREKSVQQQDSDSSLTELTDPDTDRQTVVDGDHTYDELEPWALPKLPRTSSLVSLQQNNRSSAAAFSDASREGRSSQRAAISSQQMKQGFERVRKTGSRAGRSLTESLPSSESRVPSLILFTYCRLTDTHN
jgi:hypothetical protein